MHVLLHADPVVDPKDTEADQDDDLQRHTGDDGVVPPIEKLLVGRARSGGDASPDGLEDEAREVSGEEDDGVPRGPEPGQGRVEGQADVLEREVDGDADEGRAQDDGADLQLEGPRVPGVAVHQRAADVAGGLEQEAARQAGAVGPGALPRGQEDGGREEGAEDDGEEDGGAEVRGVAQDGGLDGAELGDLSAFSVGFAVGCRFCFRHGGGSVS